MLNPPFTTVRKTNAVLRVEWTKRYSLRRALRTSWLVISGVSLFCCYLRFSLYLKFHYPNGDFIWTIGTHGVIAPALMFTAYCTERKKARTNQGGPKVEP